MIKLYDRIKEKVYTIGTGNFVFSGAFNGFATFDSVYVNNDALFYSATDGTNYELGSGVFNNGELHRFPTISNNSNNLVDFPEGLKEVYVNYPATNAVFNGSGINNVPVNSGLAFWTSSNSISSDNNIYIDSVNNRIGINQSEPDYSIDIGGLVADSLIKSSGLIVGNSGITFMPNANLPNYNGGVQMMHFVQNELDSSTGAVEIFELGGDVNEQILLKKQNAGTFFAGPSNACTPPCNPEYPTFRSIVVEDVPDLSNVYSTRELLTETSGNLKYYVDSSIGEINDDINAIPSLVLNQSMFCEGRLSVSYFDPQGLGSSNSLHYLKYNGDRVSLFSTFQNRWNVYTISELAAPLDLTPFEGNKLYDVFLYENADLLLHLIPWDSNGANLWDQSRSVASGIVVKDSAIVCSENADLRYVGTIFLDGDNYVHNDQARTYLHNAYNRTSKIMYASIDYSWSTNTTSWRKTPGLPYLEVVNSQVDDIINIQASVHSESDNNDSSKYLLGISKNNVLIPPNTTDNVINIIGRAAYDSNDNVSSQVNASHKEILPLGYTRYFMSEIAPSPNASTQYIGNDLANNNHNIGGIFVEWRY